MDDIRIIKAIMLCEGKSKEQALFYYLRIINGYSFDIIKIQTGISINGIKKAEKTDRIYKRLPINIQKKLCLFYGIKDINKIKEKIDSIKIYPDEIVNIYQRLFNYSHLKAMLYVHSKISGCSKKEYQHLVRITRVNLNNDLSKTKVSKLILKDDFYNMAKIS